MLIDPELVLAALARTPLFARLDDEGLQRLLEAIDLYQVPEGHTLFAEGADGDALYVVLSGRISIRRGLSGNEFHELAELKEDAVFGEMALIDGAPRMASAVAVTECIVAGLSRATFERLAMEKDPLVQTLLRSMAGVLCGRLREVTHVLQGMVDFEQSPSGPENLVSALTQGMVWN
jgi:CRP/FNR family transcriptional regulator, cyclic AMP receptor protein